MLQISRRRSSALVMFSKLVHFDPKTAMCGFAILLFANPSSVIAVHQTFAISEASENLFQGVGCGKPRKRLLVPFVARETAFAKIDIRGAFRRALCGRFFSPSVGICSNILTTQCSPPRGNRDAETSLHRL